MTYSPSLSLVSVLVVSAGVLTACSTGESPREAQVDLREFAVEVSSSRLAAGSVNLTVENIGEFAHTLVISHEDGTVIAGTQLVAPGESTTLATSLPVGVLSFTCRIVTEVGDGALVDHYERGMAAT
ncbi:MAG TPA: hypothetical protein VM470_02830, partial [Acidimicrobiia bacterium]|nr:hypothetical protein [Acidimicrobiia bacterium]